MSDAPPADAVPTKKPNILVLGLVGLNAALLAAAGAYFFLTSGAHAASSEAEASDDAEADEADEGEPAAEGEEGELGPLVEFESMVVNLVAPTPDHYLKVTFQLEVRGEDDLEHVESRMVPFRDQVLAHLVSLPVERVVGPDRGSDLRAQLLEIAQRVFGRHVIRNIYFTELLVQ
jgi:flagellar basal body-associated protein FliL